MTENGWISDEAMTDPRVARAAAGLPSYESADLTALRALVADVEGGIEAQRLYLQSKIKTTPFYAGLRPEDMVDMNGRPILLDAQVRLLEARIVLARLTA